MKQKLKPEDYAKTYVDRSQPLFDLEPSVTLKLKNQHFMLEYNNWAVKEVLKATKVNLIEAGFTMGDWVDPEKMGILLYCGLVTNHPELTQEAVDKLLTYRHYPLVLQQIGEALRLFMPDMADVELDESKDEVSDTKDPIKQPAKAGSGTGQ